MRLHFNPKIYFDGLMFVAGEVLNSRFLLFDMAKPDRTFILPVLCALWAVTGTSQEWWRKPERRLALRKIKAFDPIWFELAFGKAVAACLALDILVPGEMNVG